MHDLLRIEPAGPGDAGELLTLQRAAYVTQAQLYDDPHLPPLTQTLDELRADLGTWPTLKAVLGGRIVGTARARAEDGVLRVGRLSGPASSTSRRGSPSGPRPRRGGRRPRPPARRSPPRP